MRKILTILLVVCHCMAFAQIKVSSAEEYDNVFKQAEKQNKLVFIDFYTDWCLPCKQMDSEVFALQNIKSFMDERFLFVKVNAEKGYGIELAKKYAVKSYPTFLVLKKDKSEYFQFIGKKAPNEFIEIINKNLDNSRSDTSITARYEAGERNPKLMQDYLALLRKNRQDREVEIALHEYFNSLSNAEKSNEENWFMYSQYASSFKHPRIKYLVNNLVDFQQSLGEEKVNNFLLRLGRVELLAFANGNKANKGLNNEEHYKLLKEYLVNSQLIKLPNINALVQIADARFQYDNGAESLLVVEKEFDKLSDSDKFILMINLPPRKGEGAEEINKIQERILTSNVKNLSDDNKKIINRILDSYVKYDLKNGVNFEELSYENVLQASSKSGKLVFIDFYTDWCGPCKAMTQDVFPTEVVGKYFNTNLHAIKINAEKGDGVSISKKYKINAYPTMLVVDASGKEVGRLVGYKTPRELIGELEKITK